MLASLFELYQTGVKPCARPPCSHASATTSWAFRARSASSQPTGWTSAHRTSNPGRLRSLRAGGAAWWSVSNVVASSGDRTDENLLVGVTGPPSLGVAPAVPTGTLPCRDCRLSSLLPPCQGGPLSRATSRARTRTATDTASLAAPEPSPAARRGAPLMPTPCRARRRARSAIVIRSARASPPPRCPGRDDRELAPAAVEAMLDLCDGAESGGVHG
jgi:hypothetical protein